MDRFSAKVFKIDINPVVEPPETLLEVLFEQAGRSKGPIPVRGTLKGAESIQTLVKFREVWRLYINGQMLMESGLNVGDRVDVEIEFAPASAGCSDARELCGRARSKRRSTSRV